MAFNWNWLIKEMKGKYSLSIEDTDLLKDFADVVGTDISIRDMESVLNAAITTIFNIHQIGETHGD